LHGGIENVTIHFCFLNVKTCCWCMGDSPHWFFILYKC
jgi:hypothetical protein